MAPTFSVCWMHVDSENARFQEFTTEICQPYYCPILSVGLTVFCRP